MNQESQQRYFPPYTWLWLIISAGIISLDMWSKTVASEHLVLYRPVEIFPWLNMTLAHNYGAAFSFLSDAGGWQRWLFTFLPAVISIVLLVWLFRLPRAEWRTALALALILGGAIGNLAGRVEYGYVVDFVDVYYQSYHFPAFNVADSSIFCGVVLLLLDGILQSRQMKSEE